MVNRFPNPCLLLVDKQMVPPPNSRYASESIIFPLSLHLRDISHAPNQPAYKVNHITNFDLNQKSISKTSKKAKTVCLTALMRKRTTIPRSTATANQNKNYIFYVQYIYKCKIKL